MISRTCFLGFTRLDALAVVVGLGLTLVILWQLRPRSEAPGPTAVTSSGLDQTRALTQALLRFAQENKGWFPGLDHEGNLRDASVRDRFKVLLQRNLVASATLLQPLEPPGTPGIPAPGNMSSGGTFSGSMTPGKSAGLTTWSYSYALPDIASSGGRRSEWRDTANDKAPAVSDRNIGTDAGAGIASLLHPQPGAWWGNVAYVDGHGETRRDAVLPVTILGRSSHTDDHLFVSSGPDDALMRHEP